jgi:DeoR family glycerol-3-phosphate regulon repressor
MHKRQQDILALAHVAGRVTVDELATKLELTPQTIRKDLNQLCEEGYLRRTRGGASVASAVDNVRYRERRLLAREAKIAIGKAVAARIPDGASLFINIGTTTEEVARGLTERSGLLVITNNLNVAEILASSRNELILAGGRLRVSDNALVGPFATEFIRNFKVDIAVIGASAIDSDGTLLDFDAQEVEVARAIIANARRTILASDSAKFARSAPIRIGNIAEIGCFVTDRIVDADFRNLCASTGVELVETMLET